MFQILLAEDDLPLRKLTKRNLELRGFCVHESGNGNEALSVLENKNIDLVIADIIMPDLDGNELTKAIKSLNPDLPVLMLTELNTIGDKRKSFEGGADDYMTKPVNFEELELRLRALLRRYGCVSTQKIQAGNTQLDFSTKTLKVNSLYTPKGGKISVGLSMERDWIIFSVTNTGDSLAGKEELIFQSFYTSDRSGAEKGTGLGLPLVKKFVQKLGGEILLSFTQSTQFIIKLAK